jgi:phenylacetic acid degradation operon negative regulatory protein
MLPFMIVVSTSRDTADDTDRPLRATEEVVSDASLTPLDARSIALSVLLGSHPPVLPARAFVAIADLFGIAGGTMRTALSRMVAAGELRSDDGRYQLAGRLLERQRSQDAGRHDPEVTWDGGWHSIVAAADQRDLAERRRFRTVMGNHRFGELRPDIWMRPSNLPPPRAADDWIVTTGTLAGIDPVALRDRLWQLDHLRATATALHTDLVRIQTSVDWSDAATIPLVFTTSAAVVRFLRAEPLLPPALVPDDWPVPALRVAYDGVEQAFQRQLRAFLTGNG